ncbi:MAG: hypothetical protein EOM34_08800 [Clostridia bacterium]|nr:hypothetical protein [Lachnospiraceae bacterium]NCC00764.1 hypothetical protein [Clostridia bacterium]NCD03128.1 hypothetical protein [Clostridia bacterium]
MDMMVDEHQEIQYIVVMYSGWEREGHLEKVKRDARVVTEARGVFASQDFEVIYNEKEIWINFGEEEIEKVFAKERIEIGYDKNDAIQYIKLNDMTEDEYEWLKYELKHGNEFKKIRKQSCEINKSGV